MTTFAAELSREFTVISFDSLGFGYSEKPPLSYNQYLWRDQVVDFIRKECTERGVNKVTLMGNSIGGFTVASVAAILAVPSTEEDINHMKIECNGLVLMNSAGKIIVDGGLTDTPFLELFKPYGGPPSEFLRVFGKVVFTLLQPNIERMLVWLYPSNPEVARLGLAGTILRDSQDPGASDVIAAGGKLPTPRPMNDIFREYTGPILIAQGSLDPLNDAPTRAKQFENIRKGITVDLLPLGHCPMDENPKLVADSVIKWGLKEGVLGEVFVADSDTADLTVAV
jgi:pimeloyl-ACP methyl ester carboxylesterase